MTELAENTIVAGRYAIRERLGSGGMADVYRADDTHLGREVALKVLHRRFAQDAEFVERFRREARSAASLQHPNIVGVFDRGDHDGTYWIAMERLRGRTLKDVVAAEAPMDQLRAIGIGVQILNAAGFAHRHGVIHRDFKPHNVIVDDAGNAKVTDFGIARAGASEMTETGSIMGTAQYLSPEQAQGHGVAATADVYSIGVMLYEMLTGRLPFEGDSAVSIALKHLSEPPPPMSRGDLRIEPNLEQVVLGALAKEPAARWQSAEDFAAALEACRPYVLAQSQGQAQPPQDTQVFAALPAAAAGGAVAGPAGPPPERRRRWPLFALALAVLALVAVMAYVFTRPAQVAVPKVVGLSLSDARTRLDREGFTKVQVDRRESVQPVDRVLEQSPRPASRAPTSETVRLVVSSGPGTVTVPSVRDLPRAVAIRRLNRLGLETDVTSQASSGVRAGIAITTIPGAGTVTQRGGRVTLVVSSGRRQIAVPDVVGLSSESAQARLTDARFGVRVVEQNSDRPKGEVLSQSPPAGTRANSGDTVTITVSKGKEQVAVPDLNGLTERAALRLLRAAGLTPAVRRRTTPNQDEDGIVLDQRPGNGAQADKGSRVVVVVGRAAPPATTPTAPTGQPSP